MRFSFTLVAIPPMLFVNADPAPAQQFAIGVKGGVRITDDTSGSLSSESQRYTIGPTVEVRLPLGLGVEFDALYQRFGFTGYSGSCCGASITRERASSWEFPIIGKYRLPMFRVHPFLGVGYAPRTVHGTDVSSGYFLSGITTNPPASVYTTFTNRRFDTQYPVTHGVVVSGGVDGSVGRLRISPEVRYLHWNRPFLDQLGGDGSFMFQSKQDELQVLLGISWH